MPKKEKQEPQLEKRKSEVAVETLSDDSDDDDTGDQDDSEGLYSEGNLTFCAFILDLKTWKHSYQLFSHLC